jgi:hypothetical protein
LEVIPSRPGFLSRFKEADRIASISSRSYEEKRAPIDLFKIDTAGESLITIGVDGLIGVRTCGF